MADQPALEQDVAQLLHAPSLRKSLESFS
jgi:hypothetical protein